MLEGLVAWVINNYLGKYVENLNTDQFRIALLQGAVELENLPLKKDALRQVGLPIQVRAGHIGRVKLKIPVSQITSAPWEINMEQLYLVVGPLRLSELDEEVEEQALQDFKLSQLDAVEALWRSQDEQNQEAGYYASSYSSWLSLSMGFAANIVENLQLKIKDVHLRFEDEITMPGQIFAAGVQIESLAMQSCDRVWNPCFISTANQEESFKLMEMTGFAVYWDQINKSDMMGDLSLPELTKAMSDQINHDYLLRPVKATAHVKRNLSALPLRSKVNPRIVCELSLEQVPLSLTEAQYRDIVGCKNGLKCLQRKHKHLRARPKRSVKEDPASWWLYAIARVLKPRPSWEISLNKARENMKYVEMYCKILSNPSAPLVPEMKEFKDKIEWERDFNVLKALRENAMSKIRPSSAPEAMSGGVGVLASWFPQWWGWHSRSSDAQARTADDAASLALEEKLLDALADTVETNTILKRDTIFGQFNFTLKQGSVNLCSSTKETLMELQFENVRVGFELRPRTSSHSFFITLGGLYLKDHLFKDSAFPVLISPQKSELAPSGHPGRSLPPSLARLMSSGPSVSNKEETPLFHLAYEFKPLNCNADRRLEVKSKSLDIVYNPGATKWILDFFMSPYEESDLGLRQAARQSYHAMKRKTKQQLLNNWDNIMHGQKNSHRRGWDVELDISAPQIFLVEHFNDKNAILFVVDFGKLHFTNRPPEHPVSVPAQSSVDNEDDEEEAFQTPCSTPPGSEASSVTSSRKPSVDQSNLDELILHNKLYERYRIELSDLQILVGCVRDNWKFAHLRGTSSLHIVDKFNITLQMERRVVHTIDPQFPSLTVTGNLPKLVAHINENKVKAIRTLFDVISGKGLVSPTRSFSTTPTEDVSPDSSIDDDDHSLERDSDTGARLLMLHFSVDQMSLEVQSRGRSVAELQVTGVRLTFTKRPFDTSFTLSVHGLLLVDALQTFGPDFELLVASHKHVGMDSVSGSLQDSEPTSPTSPASPDPEIRVSKTVPTSVSPVSISQAVSTLDADRAKSPLRGKVPSPPRIKFPSHEFADSETLITIEFIFVNADCPTNDDQKEHLQIANIQFNNLDIIANQETIVELVGFVHRVFPKQKHPALVPVVQEREIEDLNEGCSRRASTAFSSVVSTRTQLTFDFHRLNVLLLRAVVKDSVVVGRKIATATMTEAKILANVGSSLEVEGSLGGLQVLDLTPEGQIHQRILSLGEDPLTAEAKSSYLLACLTAEMYNISGASHQPRVASNRAFCFSVKRQPLNSEMDVADISIQMASVWYVHSPHLLNELRSCAVEFKQYLSNLFSSIKSAATEMAIGIVHARAEALAQSLSMGGRLYGSSSDISQTPRKRRSFSCSMDHLESSRGSVTPRSPTDSSCRTWIKYNVVLASPVVILPRKPSSTQCVVAYLGSISLTNTDSNSQATTPMSEPSCSLEKYDLNISEINLYTIDISQRLTLNSHNLNESYNCLIKAEELYGNKSDGAPVLHNTSILLTVLRSVHNGKNKLTDDILLDSVTDGPPCDIETFSIKGSVVSDVKFSLSRAQYEQLIETVDYVLSTRESMSTESEMDGARSSLEDIVEEPELHTGVSALNFDPALRARMVAHSSNVVAASHTNSSNQSISVGFELPVLTLELIADLGLGEQKFVELSFKDLIVQFEKSQNLETNVQISLHSVMMEDLQKPVDSKHRFLMVSSNASSSDPLSNMPGFVSRSCPNLSSSQCHAPPCHSSLPDHLETGQVFGDGFYSRGVYRHHHVIVAENSVENRMKGTRKGPACPYTPPPSPRGKTSPSVYNEDNLVYINIVTKLPVHPNLNGSRSSSIDFNSLDVVVNVESWVVVLDFFGISDISEETKKDDQTMMTPTTNKNFAPTITGLDSNLDITIKSLSLLLNKAEYEVGKAVMSNFSARLVSLSGSDVTNTKANFDSFVLYDLTPAHSYLYRERFITAGLHLSMNKYNTPDFYQARPFDIKIKLDLTSLVYVHSQRYVGEIQAFFNLFPHLRREVGYFRGKKLEDDENAISARVLLEIKAPSPIIILPMSSQSTRVLIADLGNLSVSNTLAMSDSDDIISKSSDPMKEVLLDVMKIEMERMDLFTGEHVSEWHNQVGDVILLGSYAICRKGQSLLKEKCHLSVQVERNLMRNIHCVPDLSIHGTLSTLAAALTLEDYKLISGLLSFNIGECLDDLQIPNRLPELSNEEEDDVWINTYLKFDLVNVNISLISEFGELACVNFIKSSLTVDNRSNRTQDIDLVSQEILITDIRYLDQPANKRSNVFTNILQPILQSDAESVQAQIHHRKNLDSSKFTILLNNMRLMAVLDWWESVRDFIMTKPDNVPSAVTTVAKVEATAVPKEEQQHEEQPFELKLNITDSEIVVLQDTSQWDTNAVILKSTTVITYRPTEVFRPVSFNLNHCEMFSCILGLEDETALSIIDPVTVNMEIIRKQDSDDISRRILRVHMANLSLRLSYHDFCMFMQMIDSLPKQTQAARNRASCEHPVNFRNQLDKLQALGFKLDDCSEALAKSNGQLDEAALWLTQNAVPVNFDSPVEGPAQQSSGDSPFSFNDVEIETDSVCLCVIDDCRDADVPLAEFLFNKLEMKKNIEKNSGFCKATISVHYYNRVLSGWEPFLEPWSFSAVWDRMLCSRPNNNNGIDFNLCSQEILNINITGSLIDLYKSVKEIWTQDYYNPKEGGRQDNEGKHLTSPPGYRRRSPFVPFALKNDTGSRLFFTTVTTTETDLIEKKIPSSSIAWVAVDPNATVPFSFHERGKVRHRDSHKLLSHQIAIRVEGWQPITPVTVDRVGIYFRQAFPDLKSSSSSFDVPQARVVLEVTLEGSARKLVTVRSALQVINQLDHVVEIKLDNTHLLAKCPMHLTVMSGQILAVPLSHAMAQMWIRPLTSVPPRNYAFSNKPIGWQQVDQPGQFFHLTRMCGTNQGQPFRFCAAIHRENYPVDRHPPLTPALSISMIRPAHTITLIPPLTVVNLLPYELFYRLKDTGQKHVVKPGQQNSLYSVDLESLIELNFNMENFTTAGVLQIPPFSASFTSRLKLYDQEKRRLHLHAGVQSQPGACVKVTIYAPYWFVNKTAIPLVFRQEGVSLDTAGQYEEHEVARMVAPLLFSFADQDSSPTVTARVGMKVHDDGIPHFCRAFTLQPGVLVRRLNVSLRDNRPDLVYMIGIEVRKGRGRYNMTSIVTLSAHYQIHNKSSYRLQFAQKCFASTVSDPGAQATYLNAVPHCSLPFHWPRLDKDQLLCVKILDVSHCMWSGGFCIDGNNSFHLNIRTPDMKMFFLRVEIVLQGATYFIVISDADTMPPPIRIDNLSYVPMQFCQVGLTGLLTTLRAQSSTPYAVDEPCLSSVIAVTAPGGDSANLDLNNLGEGPVLTYENFIYIAFTGTFKNIREDIDVLDVESQQLVLDVPDLTTGKVVLARKQQGARSQLWRMTADGQLHHEGSSPPRSKMDKTMVLDIAGPAPQPTQYVGLILRRPDKRRSSTQSWRFTEDGRLCCAHNSMCVQAKDGFYGLKKEAPHSAAPWQLWSEAVLGPPQAVTYQTTETGLPLEQAVSRQRLRPGSGFLSLSIETDGPTRVLKISDIKEKKKLANISETGWSKAVSSADNQSNREIQINVDIPYLGVSLVSRNPPEELIYIRLSGIRLASLVSPSVELLDACIHDIQVDNQVFDAQCPVVLYVTPVSRSTDPEEAAKPVIHISAERTPSKHSYNADIFKHLVVQIKNVSLIIEERLLLKLFLFIGWKTGEEKEDSSDESDFETQRILAEAASVHARRFYFGSLAIIFTQVRLSVMTTPQLSPRLAAMKKKLGLTLIRFENATVDLEPFAKKHWFESGQFIVNSILKHYKDEMKWRAAVILGSVDFLGNPLGFMSDLSEGMSGLLYELNPSALVKNVAHGLSNSAAKVTESLGDGLGRVVFDETHEERRRKIRVVKSGSSSDHLVAGFKGLGFGILGGVTSVFKQTYDGYNNDGLQGSISGLAKGLVGTVTKPVVGVLDLVSEASSAIRDSSRSSSKQIPPSIRLPRCVSSPAGFLPQYNAKQSQGQEFLYNINKRDYSELFMAYEILRSGSEDLRIVVSSEKVRVFSYNASTNNVAPVFEESLEDLVHCLPQSTVTTGSGPVAHYIELVMKVDHVARSTSIAGMDNVKRPRVRCDSEAIASWVCQQINYAKARFVERQHTLVAAND